MSVCREQFADNDHSVLQLFLIESAYYREPDFLIFQRAMNICFADRLNPFVLDPANNWPLYNSENYDFSVWLGGAIFDLQAQPSKNCVFQRAWASRRTPSTP